MQRPALVVALCAVLASGCASRHGLELPDINDFETRRAVLGSLEHWDFRGRIGVSSGNEGFNGKLFWAQDGQRFTATVSGPLGVGTVRLAGDPAEVVVTDRDGVATTMTDVEQQLEYRYGWTIPVQSLRYWALGIPDPDTFSETQFDDGGMLMLIEQRGWTIRFAEYREGGGQAMPRRITASHADSKVRLIIDTWVIR